MTAVDHSNHSSSSSSKTGGSASCTFVFLMFLSGLVAGVVLSSLLAKVEGGAGSEPAEESLPETYESEDVENPEHGGGEEGDEGNDIYFGFVTMTTVVCVALVLMLLTVAFETIKEYLEDEVSDEMEVFLEKVFAELSVLGFLAIVIYLATKIGLIDWVGEQIYGGDFELLEEFESIHYFIFVNMVLYVFQLITLAQEAGETGEQWMDMDMACRSNQSDDWVHKLKEEEEKAVAAGTLEKRKPGETWVHGSLLAPQNKELLRAKEYVAFKTLRQEFILERSTEPPFRPMPKEKRLEPTFNFGRYLTLSQAASLTHIAEVHPRTWFFFAALTITFYFLAVAVGTDKLFLAWFWVALSWIAFFGVRQLRHHLLQVRDKFIPKRILTSLRSDSHLMLDTSLEMLNDQVIKEVASENNMTPLMSTSINENSAANFGSMDLSDEDPDPDSLPAWCDVDLERFHKKDRPWLAKFFVGGSANRQQVFFWMDRSGPQFYLFLIQANLIFQGIYAGVLLIGFVPFVYTEYHWSIFGLYLLLALIPIAAIRFSKKQLIALVQICALGSYRMPHIVSQVLREEKTARVVRTFVIIHKMRQLASRGGLSTASSDKRRSSFLDRRVSSFSVLEVSVLGKSFDVMDADQSGSVTHGEFRALLRQFGGQDIPDEQIDRLITSLDVDGDGNVSRDEFLAWWYESTHEEVVNLTRRDYATALFRMFDSAGNGGITVGEFKTKIDALHMDFDADEIGALVNELDHDRNGVISLNEFEHLVVKYFPEEVATADKDEKKSSN